jgi:hypothetical protein
MRKLLIAMGCVLTIFLGGCKQPAKNAESDQATKSNQTTENKNETKQTGPKTLADAATITARKEVPVLCYHQIRDWAASDGKVARDYIVPVENFKAQLKILADSGYHTILPNQLYDYLAYGTTLPAKPVMLTYDDTDDDQFTIAAPEMKKYGFKGVFFIMTVSLNRPRYMSREQVKQLSGKSDFKYQTLNFLLLKTPSSFNTCLIFCLVVYRRPSIPPAPTLRLKAVKP